MKLPWGYKEIRPGCRIADKSYTEIAHRHALGEAAIALLEKLGVSEEMLDQIMETADSGGDALAKLTELHGDQL